MSFPRFTPGRLNGAPAAAAGAPLVECADVARTFGSGPTAVVAVHDVRCTVPAGARLALTGPSGSGKSTLLHLIAGLDEPTRLAEAEGGRLRLARSAPPTFTLLLPVPQSPA